MFGLDEESWVEISRYWSSKIMPLKMGLAGSVVVLNNTSESDAEWRADELGNQQMNDMRTPLHCKAEWIRCVWEGIVHCWWLCARWSTRQQRLRNLPSCIVWIIDLYMKTSLCKRKTIPKRWKIKHEVCSHEWDAHSRTSLHENVHLHERVLAMESSKKPYLQWIDISTVNTRSLTNEW